jgi:hypothetical protein
MTPKWEKSMKTLTVIYFKPNPEHLDEYVERHCHVCTAPYLQGLI